MGGSYGSDHPALAIAGINMAKIFRLQERYADAERAYREAVEVHEKTGGSDHTNLALALSNFADFYHSRGKLLGAERLYLRAIGILEKSLRAQASETAQVQVSARRGLSFRKACNASRRTAQTSAAHSREDA